MINLELTAWTFLTARTSRRKVNPVTLWESGSRSQRYRSPATSLSFTQALT